MSQPITIYHGYGGVEYSYAGQTMDNGELYNQPDPFLYTPSPNESYSFPQSNTILFGPRVEDFQNTTLGETTMKYASRYITDIRGLTKYYGDWGASWQIRGGAMYEIDVHVPFGVMSFEDWQIPLAASENWEIQPQQQDKSLVVNGVLASSFTPASVAGGYIILPAPMQVAVNTALTNNLYTLSSPSGSLAQYADWIGPAQMILNYARAGITSIQSYTQVLKRSAVIDRNNSNQLFQTAADIEQKTLNAQGNVNVVYSTPDLILNYGIPQDTVAKFMYPSYSKQMNVATYDPFVMTSYAGWLAGPITAQFITRTKVQLSQYFYWNEWAGHIYYINSSQGDFPLNIIASANPSTFNASS